MAQGQPGKGPNRAGAAFLVLWMTVWLAAILIAVWTMGEAALRFVLTSSPACCPTEVHLQPLRTP